MIRAFAKLWAKWRYLWKQEVDAATVEMNALATAARAGEKRLLMGRMNAQADAIEENMKRVAQEESGDYCECEKGHRKDGASTSSICLLSCSLAFFSSL